MYNSSGTVIFNTTDVNTSSLTALAVNGSDVYVANSGYVWHFNGSVWTRFSHDADGPVYGLTYMEVAGKRLLLLPCSKGYGEVLLDDSGRPEAYQEPGTKRCKFDQYQRTQSVFQHHG